MPCVKEEDIHGNNVETSRKTTETVTTDVAARVLRVTPRTIRSYIKQGKLEAESRGEGVEKTWLVSVQSLRALRDEREYSAKNPRTIRTVSSGEINAEDLFREVTDRLEVKAAEVGELRARLAMIEQAESTLREERRRLIKDLERERKRADQELRRAEEAERTAERLVQERRRAREEARWLEEELEAERGKGFWRGLFHS